MNFWDEIEEENSQEELIPPTLPTGISELNDLLGGGLHLGEIYFIHGEKDAGKTSFTDSICAYLAQYNSISVAYLDTEGSRDRTYHARQKMNLKRADGAQLVRHHYGKVQTLYDLERVAEEILLRKSRRSFSILVLDTTTDIFGRKSTGPMEVLRQLRRAGREKNLTSILISHSFKNGNINIGVNLEKQAAAILRIIKAPHDGSFCWGVSGHEGNKFMRLGGPKFAIIPFERGILPPPDPHLNESLKDYLLRY